MAKESTNGYGAENTRDYTQEITAQYEKVAQDRAAQTEQAVQNATENLGEIAAAGDRAAAESAKQARTDAAAIRETESAIEQNNGNRQMIGHSQYGVAENSYDQQMAAIESYRQQLQTDISRQVSDLKAQGKYEDANAALQAAQEKFKQIYADQLRLDSNLRGNYEYQTGLRREDEAIQREEAAIQRAQSEADKAWNRELGEFMLKHNIIPGDNILAAMGLDSNSAKLYMQALNPVRVSSGGGGGTKKATTPTTPTTPSAPASDATPEFGSVSAYDNGIASQIYTMAKNGNLDGAKKLLNNSYMYFSEKNFKLVGDQATKKYYQTAEQYSKYF